MTSSNPIGVFDSGVGGLSVLREIRRELPHEDLLYVADSGHAPYGDKPGHQIEARAVAITEFLLGRNAKAIVVACNTATSAAVATLRGRYTIPIVAMEPAVKPAAAHTKSGVVGVLATSRTLGSDNFARLHERFGADVKILMQACPGLVELVEAGNLSGDETRTLLERYIKPLLEQHADTLVLGCTHYPFLAPLIREIAGPSVAILDPAAAIARELRRRLDSIAMLSQAKRDGEEYFWTSGSQNTARPVIAQLWKNGIDVQPFPDIATR
ncbi:MAG: glutamate racemase [Nitrosomonadales bacterium]|nr:glutamate racemase [Nitrosomonadales bacterium]